MTKSAFERASRALWLISPKLPMGVEIKFNMGRV
jgi:hypothetical protein